MKNVSSSLTFFYKYIFTGVWICGFGLGSIVGLLSEPNLISERLLFLVPGLVATAFLFLTLGRLKKVLLVNGAKIRVSNYLTTVEYNVSDIVSVSGSLFFAPELVWFTVKRTDDERKLVVITPPMRFAAGFSQNPLVRDLKDLVARSVAESR